MGQPTYDSAGRRMRRGTELRYALVRLIQLTGPATVPELISGLAYWGFAVDGRASKTVSDALRWERRRGRVQRRGRGLYSAGEMPRSTEHRIIRRVMAMRSETGAQPPEAANSFSRSKAGNGIDCPESPKVSARIRTDRSALPGFAGTALTDQPGQG